MSGLDKLIARRRRPEPDAPVIGEPPADLHVVRYEPVAHASRANGTGHLNGNGNGNGNGHAPVNGNGHAPVNGHHPAEPATTEPATTEPAAVEPAAVEPAAVEPAAVEPAAVEPATVEPAAAAAEDPPASEPSAEATVVEPPNLRQRSRVRRRARYLRRLRELQLRDIGGLAVELHRFNRHRQDLIDLKVAAAAETAEELRTLERLLAENRPVGELRLAGIGGACAHCGAIHGSADRFCAACGAALREAAGLGAPEGG